MAHNGHHHRGPPNRRFRPAQRGAGMSGSRMSWGETGEPMTLTIPAPYADFIRTLVTAAGPMLLDRTQGSLRPGGRFMPPPHARGQRPHVHHPPGPRPPMGKGRRGGKGKGRGGKKKFNKKKQEDSSEEEVKAEIAVLENTEVQNENETREQQPQETSDNEYDEILNDKRLLKSMPEFIRQAVLKAKEKGEKIPNWTMSLLGRIRTNLDVATRPVDESDGATEDVQVVEATEELNPDPQEEPIEVEEVGSQKKEANFLKNDAETAPWLKMGQLKNKMEEELDGKNEKGCKGNHQRKNHKGHKNKNCGKHRTLKHRSKEFIKKLKNPKSFEKRIKKKFGPNEVEIIIKRTERIVPVKKTEAQKPKKASKKENAKEVEVEATKNIEEPQGEPVIDIVVEEDEPETNENEALEIAPSDLGLTQEELLQMIQDIKEQSPKTE